jgi:uncharacterized protein (DUF2147 family)
MKHLFASAAMLTLASAPALAESSPIGDWLVRDGYAHVRIDNCGGKMWGIIAWEKTPGGVDKENQDAAKRSRPILGMPILMGLAPSGPNKWSGEIYNSQNGKMYSASISVVDENTLELEGCLFPNFLCQAQNWTRARTPQGAASLPPLKSANASARQGASKKGGAAGTSDTCMRVADEARERANAKQR